MGLHGTGICGFIMTSTGFGRENRVKIIKRCVDKMLVILPFEKHIYQQWDYPVEYVGHPPSLK